MKEKKNIFDNPIIVCLLALFCCFLWGSAFPAVKKGFSLFCISSADTGSQLLFAGVRFAIAGIMVIITTSVIEKKFLYPKKKSVPKVLIISLFQTVLQYFFYYIGLARTSGVKASVIISTSVFFSLILSAVVFRLEDLTAKKIAGCIIGFIGVMAINMNGFSSDFSFTLTGEGFIMISTLASAFSSVIMKSFSKDDNPMMLSGWQFFIGGIFLSVLGFSLGGNFSVTSLSSATLLLYMSFISAAAYTIWAILLKHRPVSEISVYGFTKQIFGVALSALFLGEVSEALSIKSLVSLILVCAGIFIVNRQPKKILN
ncbi:MAG: DMT family transporter [Oscillospiraceae bacterium]